MVTYELKSKTSTTLEYAYWPDGDKTHQPGTILVDFCDETILITKGAELDRQITFPVESFDLLREGMRRMQEEEGLPEGMEDEPDLPPVRHPVTVWQSGSHPVNDIQRRVNDGECPESGSTMWY